MSATEHTPAPTTRSLSSAIYLTIGALLSIAVLSVLLRSWLNIDDRLPAGDSAWMIKIAYQVEALEKGAAIYISPPWDTRFSRLFSQSVSHSGLRLKRTRAEKKRDIMLIAPEAGVYDIVTDFSVHISSLARTEQGKTRLSENNRSRWLLASPGVSVGTALTSDVVDRLASSAPASGELIEKLFNYVSNTIRIKHDVTNESEFALSRKYASTLGSNHALLSLLRSAHMPARLVSGVNLQAAASVQPFYWVEVYDAESWVPLDPVRGYFRELPAFYVPLRKGDDPLVMLENAELISTYWTIDTIKAPAGLSDTDATSLTDVIDLNRLSPVNRENLGILLLLPLGVLATEIMRQLMGVRTYGTFTPSLMALAIVHVDRVTAIIVFILVTVIGVTIRAYMPKLNLQRTARLAMVFTLVSVSMAIVMSTLIHFDPSVDSVVVLLPVVVLTMLVDSIYRVADQRGMRTAMIRLLWTVIAAIVSLFVLLQADWSIWLVSYPETHAITLALIIIIGLYQGPKLSSVPVLSWLHEPDVRVLSSTDKQRRQRR